MNKNLEKVEVELTANNVENLRMKFEKEIEKIREECNHPKIERHSNPMDSWRECKRCGRKL